MTAVAFPFGPLPVLRKITRGTFAAKLIFVPTPTLTPMTRPSKAATNKANSSEFDFALVIEGLDELSPTVLDALYESGCDDATFAMRSGRTFATFSRVAGSFKEAILSAIKDIRSANVGAVVLRVDYCNLVTQAEIARRIGRTRQLVHQYMTGVRGPGGFPAPACDVAEGTSLWYWCEVAYWLWENSMIQENVLREAEDVDAINCILELEHQKKRNGVLAAEIAAALAAR